jgi:ATP-dependent protease HslVU (ClpYQ) peptidase subunit
VTYKSETPTGKGDRPGLAVWGKRCTGYPYVYIIHASMVNVTVIAAYVNKNSYAIGGDRGIYDADTDLLQLSAQAKIWSYNDSLFGACGSPRAITVGREIRQSNPYQFAEIMCSENIEGDWQVLIARRDGVWYVDSDQTVVNYADPYGAIGSGEAVALGALAVYNDSIMGAQVLQSSARSAVNYALLAASKHTASCVPPHNVICQYI